MEVQEDDMEVQEEPVYCVLKVQIIHIYNFILFFECFFLHLQVVLGAPPKFAK